MTRISVSHGECQDTSSRIRSSIRNCNWENKKKKQRNTNNTSISMDTRSVFVLFLLTVVVVCWCGGSAVILVPSIEAFLLSSTTSSASSSSSILLLKYENNDADTDDHTIGDRHRGVAVSRRTVFTETATTAAAATATGSSVFGRSSTNLIRAGLSFGTATATAAGCCGACLRPQLAYGMAQLTTPSFEQTQLYDLPRNALQDMAFAQGMAVGMADYERAAYPTKQKLFRALFASLPTAAVPDQQQQQQPTIVEIGIGSFPNALYYTPQLTDRDSTGLDIIGIDPNDRMEGYAQDNAKKAGLHTNPLNSLRVVHGVSEALPFDDHSVDAVVCSLTLCSVIDPRRSVAEIKRILKPQTGKFLFWEHVLSQTDSKLAADQIRMTPTQIIRADGCHLDRVTGQVILNEFGPANVDLNYLELKNFGFLNPTVCGIATA